MDNTPSATPPPVSPQPSSSISEHQWGVFLHLSGFLGFFTPHLLNVIGPLVIWLIKKPDSQYLDAVGKKVLNFQISYSIYGFVAGGLCGATAWTLIGGIVFGFLYICIGIAWLVLTIMGAVKESNRQAFEFPFVIKFLVD